MDAKLIKEAANSLSLLDIYLLDFKFEPHKEYHPSIIHNEEKLITQDKKEIRCKKAVISDEEEDRELFLVEASLGTRVLDKEHDEKKESEPFFTLEATFRAEYIIKNTEISDDALKEFARNNGLHSIWPFWRQFVFDMMPRLRLPTPEVPLRTPLI